MNFVFRLIYWEGYFRDHKKFLKILHVVLRYDLASFNIGWPYLQTCQHFFVLHLVGNDMRHGKAFKQKYVGEFRITSTEVTMTTHVLTAVVQRQPITKSTARTPHQTTARVAVVLWPPPALTHCHLAAAGSEPAAIQTCFENSPT